MSNKKDEYVVIPVEWLYSKIKECSTKIVEYGSSEYFIPQVMILNEIIREFTVEENKEEDE
jgi:hypothetical protein